MMNKRDGYCDYCWRAPATAVYESPTDGTQKNVCDSCNWILTSQDTLDHTNSRYCVEGQFILQTIEVGDERMLVISNEESTRSHAIHYDTMEAANHDMGRIRINLHNKMPLYLAIGIGFEDLDPSMREF